MSELKVDKITPRLGTTLTLGDSGDTINFGSGVLPNFENLTVTGDLTVDTNSLKVDSTNNNVGIGTASPNNYAGYTTLTLNNSSTGNEIDFEVAGTVKAYIEGTGSILKLWSASGSDIGFYPNASQLMTLTSSGRVGIGTASPTRLVDLSTSTGGTIIHMTDDATGHLVTDGVDLQQEGTLFQILNREAGDIRLGTNNAECMRIDSSGNVLVGKTTTDFGTVGFRVQGSTGATEIVRDGGKPLTLNRLNSDGIMLGFSVSGTDEGAIVVASGGTLSIGAQNTHLKFQHSDSTIRPSNSSFVNRDNAIDLGASNSRFKDLYLGGNAYASIVNINNASAQGRLNVSNNGAEQLEVFPGDVAGKVSLQAFNRSDITYDSFRYIGLTHEFLISGTEKMRIDSSGNVGIGTSSPDQLLHLSAGQGATLRFESTTTGATTGDIFGAIEFETQDANSPGVKAKIDAYSEGGVGNASLRFFTGDTVSLDEAMRINSSGNVNLCKGDFNNNVSASNYGWEIFQNNTAPFIQHGSSGTGFATKINFFNGNGVVGKISTDGSATTYATSSDYRLKENVVDIPNATERLKQLSPKRFNFIADANTTVDGFLAHEVQSIVPEAITGTHNEVDADGNPVYQGIDQSKLVPLLVATIKELEARIEALENA